MFKCWDGSCLDQGYMLNTVDDVLGIFDGPGYLKARGIKCGLSC